LIEEKLEVDAMSVGLLGRKVGMTQIYDESGLAIPVTVIEAGPCTVLQVRTIERDGYRAVQLGFGQRPRRLASRAQRGHVAAISSKRARLRAEQNVAEQPKAGCEPPRFIREFRLEANEAAPSVGEQVTLGVLAEASHVDVVGLNKGRGFAGVMKQHNFSGLRASHGVQRHHRAGGSIASHATDRGHSGRIKKGKAMSGRWGHERVTVRNLKVARCDEARNLLLVRGSVPGPVGGYVVIRRSRGKLSVRPAG
jgi:large subunit ribosomal protein L3